MRQDMIDLRLADIVRSPDVRSWPVTVGILAASCSADGGFAIAFDRTLPDSWKWPSNPDVPSENFQYTVWMFINVAGQWIGAGFVQMWQGRAMGGRQLPPLFADVDGVPGWRDWWGDPRNLWPPMSEHGPRSGDQIGLMITAGNARLRADVTSVAERSNLVTFPIASNDVGNVVYGGDVQQPPVPPPVIPPAPPSDETIPQSIARLEAKVDALTLAARDLAEQARVLNLLVLGGYTGTVTMPFLGKGTVDLAPKPSR